MKTIEKTRFDTKLPKEQKELFEYAAGLGGFRTLTDFIISSAQEKAKQIIEERNVILSSKQDQEIFFKALMNPQNPNEKLKSASLKFKEASS